jgi:hypothetical protein
MYDFPCNETAFMEEFYYYLDTIIHLINSIHRGVLLLLKYNSHTLNKIVFVNGFHYYRILIDGVHGEGFHFCKGGGLTKTLTMIEL